jgi:hypothetical protein
VARRQHVELHEDGGQQVVEVVRHAAGQLADGLHLLALGELQLDLLLLGERRPDRPTPAPSLLAR